MTLVRGVCAQCARPDALWFDPERMRYVLVAHLKGGMTCIGSGQPPSHVLRPRGICPVCGRDWLLRFDEDTAGLVLRAHYESGAPCAGEGQAPRDSF